MRQARGVLSAALLFTRLDQAIAKAHTENAFNDQINPSASLSGGKRRTLYPRVRAYQTTTSR